MGPVPSRQFIGGIVPGILLIMGCSQACSASWT